MDYRSAKESNELLAYTKENPMAYLIHYVNDYLDYHQVGEKTEFVKHAVNLFHQKIPIHQTTVPRANERIEVISFFNPWEQDYINDVVGAHNVEARKREVAKNRNAYFKRHETISTRLYEEAFSALTEGTNYGIDTPATDENCENEQTLPQQPVDDVILLDFPHLHRSHPPQGLGYFRATN